MIRFKVMLPEKFTVVEANSESEAIEIARKRFRDGISLDDLIAWEEPEQNTAGRFLAAPPPAV